MDIAGKLNEDVTTAVPVTDATGKLEPGTYVMVAKPAEKVKGDDGQRATQWFIVSDLGLTAFSGRDGVHAFVRSLADATAIGDVNVKLIARNNEVLGTAKTDAKGYAKFDGAIAKGEGGLAPAVLVAEKGAGEYAFLDLTLNAFDLSDRGVKGRDASGPIDAYVYTRTRRLSRWRRGQRDGAGARPRRQGVSDPDDADRDAPGRRRAFARRDERPGPRRPRTCARLAKTAQTGTWRVWLHADPKAPPLPNARSWSKTSCRNGST